jgi:hypothetical protein
LGRVATQVTIFGSGGYLWLSLGRVATQVTIFGGGYPRQSETAKSGSVGVVAQKLLFDHP